MAQLSPGVAAPEFDLLTDEDRRLRTEELRGMRTVLYFFPKADTKG